MADFTPKRESTERMPDYNVEKTVFENKSDETRLITPEKLVPIKIKTPPLTRTQYEYYRDFYESKNGSYSTFTMLDPFDNVEYTFRFVKGSWREIYEGACFVVEFSVERAF